MKSNKSYEEWKQLVLDFNESGLSKAAFCADKNFRASTFIYWVKMFNKPKSDIEKLVKLHLKSIKTIPNIQIAIDNVKLEIPGSMSTDKISRLLSVVKEVI